MRNVRPPITSFTTVSEVFPTKFTHELCPQHGGDLVDAGYPSAKLLAASQRDFGIDLYGPVRQPVVTARIDASGITA